MISAATKPFLALAFLVYFLWELVIANAVVAYEVITPRNNVRPGVIEVPIESDSDLEVILLANLITLTPGTLTLGVSPDRHAIYVHALHVKSPEHLRTRISSLERKLLRVLR